MWRGFLIGELLSGLLCGIPATAVATACPLAYVDLEGGQIFQGPYPFSGFPTARITAIAELPAAIPRVLVADADGNISLSFIFLASRVVIPADGVPPLARWHHQ